MRTMAPHLWFDTQAKEATEFYTTVLDGSKVTHVTTLHHTPEGDVDAVQFELAGQPFQAISAGPMFTPNPSISFRIDCATADEVDALCAKFSDGGTALMPLDSYPFSDRYAWVQDRFGVSWQLMRTDEPIRQKITTQFMFVGDVCGKAEEAMKLYTSVFGGEIGDITRYGPGREPDAPDNVLFASFTLDGNTFSAMDSAHDHQFGFTEGISIMVYCDTQEEIDRFSDALSAVPEAEQCGWIKDRFGVSWQIVPTALEKMMQSPDQETIDRVTQAFMPMKRLDMAKLEDAYAGR